MKIRVTITLRKVFEVDPNDYANSVILTERQSLKDMYNDNPEAIFEMFPDPEIEVQEMK